MTKVRVLLGALILTTTTACGGCDEDLIPVVEDAGTGVIDGGSILDGGFPPEDAGFEARILEYDGNNPVDLFYQQSQSLRFVLKTVSGAAVGNEAISFSTTGSAGTLNANTAMTDANGVATVRFTAGTAAGQSTITASADLADSVSVTINVAENPNAGLIVRVESNTRIVSISSDASIYIGPSNLVPSCADLEASDPLPTATFAHTFTSLPGNRTFNNLDTGDLVTVYATALTADGIEIGNGCVEGTRLTGGNNQQVTVTLDQYPTNFDGDYDTLLQFDLGTALPSPYDETVGLVTNILADPAGWAVYQTLARADANNGTTFVTWTAPGETVARIATYDEVRNNPGIFNTWNAASSALDGFLVNQLGQDYVDITTIGGDIRSLVREFEVGSEFTITSTGTTDRFEIQEDWKAIVYTWRIDCPNGDMGCARRPVELTGANANLAPLQATYGATVAHSPTTTNPVETERFLVTPDDHNINLRYGAIILLGLNEIVFPNLPGNLAGNSLGEVIGNIINCSDVAQSLANALGSQALVGLFQTVCDAGVNAAATYIENQLLALDSENNPDLLGRADQGITGGGEFYLADRDHDVQTELLEELVMYAQWTDPQDPQASQDITAPIVGDGRRAASACALDNDCDPGFVCTLIPHYLYVQALEQDCRRTQGNTAGAVGCAQDTDCESGLCYDPGTGTNICFEACDGQGTCSLGTCTTDAASYDLDPVFAGLGSATADACVP